MLLENLGGWPQNDDPFYGRPVQFYVTEGRLQLVRQYGELTASSVGHIVAGTVACLATEYSYRQLFIACIVQQAVGAVAIYFTCCWLGLAQVLSLFLSLSLCLFPLYFGHAFTFMTDGPATAWASIACCAIVVGFSFDRMVWLLVASVAVAWGIWIRQTNLLLAVVPCLTVILFRNHRVHRWLSGNDQSNSVQPMRSVAVLLASLGLVTVSWMLLESGWLIHSSSKRLSNVAPDPLSLSRLKDLIIGGYGACLLVGWLCLPVLPWLIGELLPIRLVRQDCRSAEKVTWVCGLVVLVALLIPFVGTSGRACITNATGAFIQNGHYGPIFLSDMDEPGRWGQLGGVIWPLWIWQLITLLSIVTCACLVKWFVGTICQWLRDARGGMELDAKVSVACALLGMIGASYLMVLAFVQPLMDRYWMFLFPPILLCLALVASIQSWKQSIFRNCWATVWLIAMLVMSLVFTHDLLAWNDVRWRFVNAELAKGILPHELDAGRDVNAWFRMQEDPETSHRVGDSSAWWSGLATRCIAVGPRPGWTQIDYLPWHSWATGKTHYLLILKRDAQPLPAQSTRQRGVQP